MISSSPKRGRRLGDTAHVANMLAVPISRVHDSWRNWGFEPYRVGNTLRFDLDEVEEFLDRQRISVSA